MKNKKNLFVKLVSLIICLTTFSGCNIFNGENPNESSSSMGGFEPFPTDQEVNVNVIVTDPALYGEYVAENLPEVISRVKSSVVGISVVLPNGTLNGSGTVVANSEESNITYIATSHSLIAGATAVTVEDYQTGKVYSAIPVGTDPITDVCIIRINAFLQTMPLYSESSNLLVGESIFSFSNLLAQKTMVATSGIVGATQYLFDAGENNVNSLFIADLNTSYSSLGGAIFTQKGGFLLGMIRSGISVGMPALVVPSDTLIEVATEIIKKGFVEGRYKLGVTVADNKSGWGITESVTVTELASDGCVYAEGFGLKVGDTILSLIYGGSEYSVNKAEDFYYYLYNFEFEIGDKVIFNVERNSTRSQISIEIIQYDYFSFNLLN